MKRKLTLILTGGMLLAIGMGSWTGHAPNLNMEPNPQQEEAFCDYAVEYRFEGRTVRIPFAGTQTNHNPEEIIRLRVLKIPLSERKAGKLIQYRFLEVKADGFEKLEAQKIQTAFRNSELIAQYGPDDELTGLFVRKGAEPWEVNLAKSFVFTIQAQLQKEGEYIDREPNRCGWVQVRYKHTAINQWRKKKLYYDEYFPGSPKVQLKKNDTYIERAETGGLERLEIKETVSSSEKPNTAQITSTEVKLKRTSLKVQSHRAKKVCKAGKLPFRLVSIPFSPALETGTD